MQFTVFTPVYNRRDLLHRVWDSLRAQTFRDFEWIVVDDGSTDDSISLIREYERKADFPVTVIEQENGGKHIAWNRAVELARGELFVPADSDDAFVPTTLERFRALWLSIPESERGSFSGVNVLCLDPETQTIIGNPFPKENLVANNLELAYVYRIVGEKWGCLRTDVLKQLPFPSDDWLRRTYLPESYLWFSLARKYKALCVNEPLRIYYRDAANSICATRVAGSAVSRLRRQVPGRYFFKSWNLNNNLDYLKRDKRDLIKTVLDVWISGFGSGRSPLTIMTDSRGAVPTILRLLGFPLGVMGFAYLRLRRGKA